MKQKIKILLRWLYWILYHKKYGGLARTARIGRNVKIYNKKNLIMEDFTNIDSRALIMNTRAKFIMKKYSGAAIGLTVITGNHMSPVGIWRKFVTDKIKNELDVNNNFDKDIIIENDVWIGANVTLLAGTHVGRGAIVGAGAVVRTKVPPYAIVSGNPAKIMGYVFDPEQTIEHETKLYSEQERLSKELIVKNYQKYYKKRLKNILEYQKL